MKKLYILLLVFPCMLFAQDQKTTSSKIEKATVFLEGASIERLTDINVLKGENVVVLDNLSPDIIEKSIHISGLKNTSIRSMKFELNYLEQKQNSVEFKELVSKIDDFSLQIQRLRNEIGGYTKELELLQKNQRINSDATDLSLVKVKEMSAYFRSRVTEINNTIFERRLEIAALEKESVAHSNELVKLKDTKSDERGKITLKLDSEVATNLKLQIKYNIANAGWFPLYDIKATNTNDPVSFVYKANVYQQSGVNWDNVKLVLSTGDPNTNNIKPLLTPKYLNFVSRNYKAGAAVRNEATKYNPTITKVTGVVMDDAGLPLPGANVIIMGTSTGTQTDFDGNYSIDINGGRALAYSYVGFETLEQDIHASNMNVQLKAGAALEEVVITGYSTRRLGSATSNISADDLEALVEGKAAGVQITSANGRSGASSLVRIRGTNSLAAGASTPLYVVDGMPMDEYELNQIPEEAIKSVQILKDAATTSQYGSRGTNGVVVITTKDYTSNGTEKETGITNTIFSIQKKHTINSNAEITVIEIDKFELPSTFQYYVAPELNENVFLTAAITNWEQYDLLQGEANVYFEGNYAGKTLINPLATRDSLSLSLGIDPNVIVRRKRLNNFKSKSLLGTNRVVDKGFTIEIRNSKKTGIDLIIEDRIPIPQNKEIKLDDVETSDASYNEETGILLWKMQLKPNETTTKEFKYTVKFPKYKRINL